MRRPDVLLAIPFLGLALGGIWAQIAPEAPRTEDPAVRALEVGETLDPELAVTLLGGERTRVGDLQGARATVLYAWSTACPCVPALADRLRDLRTQAGPADGVSWVAVCGEPTDRVPEVRSRLDADGSWTAVRDPAQRLCRAVGLAAATHVVVLDADGTIRYRGSPTDDLTRPTEDHLRTALLAVLAGRRPDPGARQPVYGCAFSRPADDCPPEETATEPAPGPAARPR